MRVQRVDTARRIADQANLHARIGIHDQILTIKRAAHLLVETLFPGKCVAVDGREFDVRYLPIMTGLRGNGGIFLRVEG